MQSVARETTWWDTAHHATSAALAALERLAPDASPDAVAAQLRRALAAIEVGALGVPSSTVPHEGDATGCSPVESRGWFPARRRVAVVAPAHHTGCRCFTCGPTGRYAMVPHGTHAGYLRGVPR